MLTRVRSNDGSHGLGTWVASEIEVSLGKDHIYDLGFSGIAIDGNGDLYLSRESGCVVYTPPGGNGRVLPIKFENANGIAAGRGQLFVLETRKQCVHKVLLAVNWSTAEHCYFPEQFKEMVKMLVTCHKCKQSQFQKLPKEILLHTLSFLPFGAFGYTHQTTASLVEQQQCSVV